MKEKATYSISLELNAGDFKREHSKRQLLSSNSHNSLQETQYTPQNLPPQFTKMRLPSANYYYKDCQKFLRRLSSAMVELLQSKHEPLLISFIDTAVGILEKEAYLLQASLHPTAQLQEEILSAISARWKILHTQIRCQRVSKINKSLWNTVFSQSGFWQASSDSCSSPNIQLQCDIYSKRFIECSIFKFMFQQLTFVVNKALVLCFLVAKKEEEGSFVRNLARLDDYLMMIVDTELFPLYNQKQGLFACECCGRCKVCLSKPVLSSNTRARLENAREDFVYLNRSLDRKHKGSEVDCYDVLISLLSLESREMTMDFHH